MFYQSTTRAFCGLVAALSLSACATMAPKYERPEAPIPSALPYTDEATGEEAALLDWREVFTDPELQALIDQALENNRDLRATTLNVARARALYRVQRSESLPSIDASGNYSRQRFGENASTGFTGSSTNPNPQPLVIEQYSVNAGVSAYELDLFGRVRSLNRQALETYFAADETRKAAEIALIAEVASARLTLAADAELLAIARDTYSSQQESLDLTNQLVDNGLGNDLDVQRVRTSIERARADAAALEAQVARDVNALRLLIGTSGAPAISGGGTIADIDLAENIPVGLNSDILLTRPDVQSAERQLRAANANIGAARAAFFPRILLTASAGTASAQLDNLFSPGTGVWSFAPSISVPIFAGGRNRAQLAGAKIDRDIAVADYEGAIQSAFRDVADALATRETIDERMAAVERLAAASGATFNLAEIRFENGVDGYLAVLDAQRVDYAARQELVAARLARAANIVAVFRALGGDFGAERE